jgi:hypothetical protein
VIGEKPVDAIGDVLQLVRAAVDRDGAGGQADEAHQRQQDCSAAEILPRHDAWVLPSKRASRREGNHGRPEGGNLQGAQRLRILRGFRGESRR